MEQIKDMVTLRAFASELAMKSIEASKVKYFFTENLVSRAKSIESYILGDAKLPESYEDKSVELFKNVMEKFNKPTSLPMFMWQSPEVILPKENQEVLVMVEDNPSPMIGTYLGKDDWEVRNEDIRMYVSTGETKIVAWLPIPPYVTSDEI